MKKFAFHCLIPSALVILTGCMSVGRKVDTAKADQIHKGSTKAEVRSLIGSPDQVTKNGEGVETWTYAYSHTQVKGATFIPIAGAFMGGSKVQNQNYTVTFSPTGEVTDFTSTYGGTEVTTDLQSGSRASIPEVDDAKRAK